MIRGSAGNTANGGARCANANNVLANSNANRGSRDWVKLSVTMMQRHHVTTLPSATAEAGNKNRTRRTGTRARVGAHIPVSMARRFISLSGYLTHTDSWRFCHRYHVAAIKKIAGLIVSHHDHNKTLITA